jgi:hypothetical protein
VEGPVVSVEFLQRVAAILLEHLGEVEGAEIAFDKDHYWNIPPEQRFNPYSQPSEFTMGQLSECIDQLARIAEDPEAAVSYGLVWLGDVVKAIGERTVR